ncbi:uncharacterized protein HMPREF1541_01237 [Cyphellophora europaea CBS 101466]|uniref:RNA polymerase II degradation factor 1 n=1 Tax=Cyphellophora europaea (strain CBS 101466) TaxID=1220924 RepID=W2SEC6_CYPE1|nr:uncharacterized protein HMPREF1541_01237 [Cyphellophora europaea CBS 101466]ETN47047.1 hypothetical protein HMPREF1541_01237 [Cyphellophora europaea CBS 101466]
MSEVQSARTGNSRGRGGFRGGRGGFRGGRNPSRSHKDTNEQENMPLTTLEDEGEVGELKRKFGDKIPLLHEVCPGWSDEDLVFALEETNGDLEAAVDRISSGTISQWGEVKKKQPKSKDTATSADTGSIRGRGRGGIDARGRGRGTERGARGGRGARAVSQANGTKHAPKAEDDGWGQTTTSATAVGGWDSPATTTEAVGGWDSAPTNGDTPAQAETEKASAPVETTKPAAPTTAATKKPGGWAGLFAKPPPAPKQAPASVPAAQPEANSSNTATAGAPEQTNVPEVLPPPIEAQVVDDAPSELPSAPHSEGPTDLSPGKDELTETNLEQLPDESHPPASHTVASTTASTQDPLAQLTTSAKAPVRPASGYAATALKATTGGGRSASFVRKVKEQQEAVVMPGNHAVEKAAVQFGKMGLNGDSDDLDDDREEPETRTQLPDDSPVAPRASLPPALPEARTTAAPAEPQPPTEPQAHRQAPGLPPAPQQHQQVAPQVAPGFGDPYRYGQPSKTYDPFGQPPSTQAPGPNQEPFASQVPGQPQAAGQNDMSSYYGRDAYQQYYNYQHQDAQRTGSAFGSSAPETASHYATARPQQGYGQQEATTSGNNTPAPGIPAQHTQAAQQQQQQQQQQQHMGGNHGAYSYGYPNNYAQQYPQYSQSYMNQMAQGRYGANRPMFDDARRQQDDYYGNQYAYGSNQHYGGAGSYKSGMYGQPQQQYGHEYSSSPATAGTFGGRENAYGRSGSAQPSDQPTPGSSHQFGAMPDPFGRSSSGFGQSQSLGQQHGSLQGSEDATKPSGPSPSVQAGRPGSTVNTSQAQPGGLGQPPTHNSQQAFGAYPQYGGGFGTFGGQQGAHQSSGYGTYGTNAFGTYGSYGGGRGWNH